jgi:hypothetical protein
MKTAAIFVQTMVRPAVTFGLVAVQAGLAVSWITNGGAEPAFAALSPFTMMAITFWFKDREKTVPQGVAASEGTHAQPFFYVYFTATPHLHCNHLLLDDTSFHWQTPPGLYPVDCLRRASNACCTSTA